MTRRDRETISALTVAVRAHAPRTQQKAKTARRSRQNGARTKRKSRTSDRWPRYVLAIDTETTADVNQNLQIGCYELSYWEDNGIRRIPQMGLFYADDLPELDPKGFATIERYYKQHRYADSWELRLMSREQFVTDVFYPIAYKARGLVVGFNLPFDLSRIAVGWSAARSRRFLGGFSFKLTEYTSPTTGATHDNQLYPRVRILHRNNRSALIGFSSAQVVDQIDRFPENAYGGTPTQKYRFPGHFLDLRTMTAALADRGFTLKSAAEMFGTVLKKLDVDSYGIITDELIEYLIRDVRVTGQLLDKVRDEYDTHPIDLEPTRVASSASVAKAYLAAMRITPPSKRAKRITRRQLGIAAAANFGGRAEVQVRLTPLPVTYLDFLSMYPTVIILMGLWGHMVARELFFEDATAEVQAFLATVSLDRVFDKETWPQLVGFAEIIPDGDVVPVRARYNAGSKEFTIGVNPFYSDSKYWYTIADLVASTLKTGKPPKVVSALKLKCHGEIEDLNEIDLAGETRIDPRNQNLFQRVIEERKRLGRRGLPPNEVERLDRFLKCFANSGGFGIFGELNPQTLPSGVTERVEVHASGRSWNANVERPEEPGTYCFMPFAALITGAARLMLATLDRCIAELGGTWVACDTDSMMPVTTEFGGPVPCVGGPLKLDDGREAVLALSFAELASIIHRFDRIHPYDRTSVPESILKVEEANFDLVTKERLTLYAFAISAKRYALFTYDDDGSITLRDYKESLVGRFLNPADPTLDENEDRKSWIADAWQFMLREKSPEPSWLDRPAVSKLSLTSPRDAKRLSKATDAAAYTAQFKPFGFTIAAYVDPIYLPNEEGIDPDKFRLLAAFNPDIAQWTKIRWTNTYTSQSYRITTAKRSGKRTARVKSYRDFLREYIRHPEHKRLAPSGRCEAETVGLLRERPVYAAECVAIGKEAHRLEEVESGQVKDLDEVETVYGPVGDEWESVLSIVREFPRDLIACVGEISERQVSKLWNGHSHPSKNTLLRLRKFAALHRGSTGKLH